MKVFAIRNEEDLSPKDLAYLIYYENDKRFYVELPEDADEWETPLILSNFVEKGEMTVNAYWSKQWVRQRIVPEDRQNIGQILKENGLSEYDEFGLLMLGNGRCAQDSYYLAPVRENLPEEKFKDRYEKKIEDVIPLSGNRLLVFFRDGKTKKCDIEAIARDSRFFRPVLTSEDIFRGVGIQTGGYGVCWGDSAEIPDRVLYEQGESIPLSLNDFVSFVSNRVTGGADAAELLNCSRQNINELVRHGKLHPVKTEQKATLFLKSEILHRTWK